MAVPQTMGTVSASRTPSTSAWANVPMPSGASGSREGASSAMRRGTPYISTNSDTKKAATSPRSRQSTRRRNERGTRKAVRPRR